MDGHLLERKYIDLPRQCAVHCESRSDCASFNMCTSPVDNKFCCELNSNSKEEAPTNMVDAVDMDYWEREYN